MIQSVFELNDTVVREVMVPRTDLVFIERTKTLRQTMSLCLRSGYSRIPVIDDNDLDDVLGMAYLKDVTKRVFDNHAAESTERVESIMRPCLFVPDTQDRRRPAQGDAGPAHPRRDRRRRVRRHGRHGHDRGHPRGDRRRDHRRVRHRARRASRRWPTARTGSARASTSTTWPSCSTSASRTTTSTRSAACWPSTSARCRSRAARSRSPGCSCGAEAPSGRRNRIGDACTSAASPTRRTVASRMETRRTDRA